MNPSLFRLLQLSDPALPVGGYAHSAGLETYVQLRMVKDLDTASSFVKAMLSYNLHYTDAALLSLAYDAAKLNSFEKIMELDELCTAVKLPKEMRQASQKLGMRLLKIFQPSFEDSIVNDYTNSIIAKEALGHYCVAFGMLASLMGISKGEALTGFYYTSAAGMVTNCVKLIPLSQQHGQELLFSLQGLVTTLAKKSLEPDEEKIGLCCAGFDIRSMQHERLYSRLYMS